MRSSIRSLYLTVACCVLATGCSILPFIGPRSLELSSTVVDYESLKAVEGVQVRVEDKAERVVGADTTDVNGNFLIELTTYDKARDYKIVIAKDQIVEAYSELLDLSSGVKSLPPQIKVSVLGAVRGVVQDVRDTTKVISQAVVTLIQDEEDIEERDTDPRGEFDFGFSQPGEYKLRIFAIGYIPAETNYFEIEKGKIKDIAITVEEVAPPPGKTAEEISRELRDNSIWSPSEIKPWRDGTVVR